ncbi:alpha/beta hydrolase [Micrococcus sp. EYE_162]|uniref:alpha/beta-hydrolase family protein n=1 Tax=unclassified Micrococcus TaxID=2620948 RepID=UPI0020032328|nr:MULTISPECIES: alpha/beta-hydrolase family protein [unclassified Micrococcus]MCK6095395.1 alpha/beta hydrolase [Micrococcus sp. EYE_212]MCK6171470.1 alpha/beta hydrolase [Micrococcus sp. EYE_162]
MLWVALSPSLLPNAWWMTAVAVGLSVVLGSIVGGLAGRLIAWIVRRMDLRATVDPRADWLLRLGWDLLLVGISARAWVWSLREQERTAELVGLESSGMAGQAVGCSPACSWPPSAPPPSSTPRPPRAARRRRSPSAPAPGLHAELGEPGPRRPGLRRRRPAPRPDRLPHRRARHRADPPLRRAPGRGTVEDAVAAVLAEMDRTHAWGRDVLHVTTSTGTGFVQGWSVGAVEYLTGGDVATVSLQDSSFPSALAYVSDRTTPPRAGRALFDAVRERWSGLPEDSRPRLVVSGESLGSYGGQGAFESPEDLLAEVDGAVWTGTPRFTPLWSTLTDGRRPGSPEIAPVVDNGRHIRFVTRPEELEHDYDGGPYVDWEEPRVACAQHASDPIVWWGPAMLLHEPDWMREHVGRDVSPDLGWAPWVSFWQVGMDMPMSVTTDGGHGHQYFEEVVPYWAAVLGQEWTGERIEAIQRAVREDYRPR